MTKQEFIQEAALRLLCSHFAYTMDEVVQNARDLADEIYGKEDPSDLSRPAPTVSDPKADDIEVLVREIERVEEEHVSKHNREYQERTGYRGNFQKSGFAVRLRTVSAENGIRTVGDLLALGRYGFLKLPKVGKLCTEMVDETLGKLYNIKNW